MMTWEHELARGILAYVAWQIMGESKEWVRDRAQSQGWNYLHVMVEAQRKRFTSRNGNDTFILDGR